MNTRRLPCKIKDSIEPAEEQRFMKGIRLIIKLVLRRLKKLGKAGYRDLVILGVTQAMSQPETMFKRLIEFAEDGGLYIKLGRGKPKYASKGCKAYVVFCNQIIGVLNYDGVCYVEGGGETLGGDEDDYITKAGEALKFVGPYKELEEPIPYRKGFRGWEYLPGGLETKLASFKHE